MKTFYLERSIDETGVSGTGMVAEGIIFSDGHVAMRWCVPNIPNSTASYEKIEDVEQIHGHDGKTKVIIEVQPLKKVYRSASSANGS